MLFLRDERLGVQTQHPAQLPQELGRRLKADGRLQIGLAQTFGQTPAKLTVHDHVGIGIHQVPHLGQMRAKRHHHVDRSPDAFDHAADLMQVRRHVEGAIHRPKDVDARLVMRLTRAFGRHAALGHAEFGKDPGHRAVGALPLIFINRARQKALDIGARRGHPAADHLGNAAGDNHRRQRRVQGLPRPRHRRFGARGHFALAQTRHHNRQLMWGQRIGVMQDRSDRQILAADRTVDDNLQSLDRTEGVDRPPVAARAIMILDQHDCTTPALNAESVRRSVKTEGRRKEDAKKIISSPPLLTLSRPCRASFDGSPGSPAEGSAHLPRCPPYRLRQHPRRTISSLPSGSCPRWRH